MSSLKFKRAAAGCSITKMYLSICFIGENDMQRTWIMIDPATSKKGWVTGRLIAITRHSLDDNEILSRGRYSGRDTLSLRFDPYHQGKQNSDQYVVEGGAVYRVYMGKDDGVWYYVESDPNAYTLWEDSPDWVSDNE